MEHYFNAIVLWFLAAILMIYRFICDKLFAKTGLISMLHFVSMVNVVNNLREDLSGDVKFCFYSSRSWSLCGPSYSGLETVM